MFKNELSFRKEKSYPNSKRLSELINPNSKRLSELINSRHKSFDKRDLGFVDESTIPNNDKTTFLKPSEGVLPKKTHSKLKFHCTHCTKIIHIVDRFMQRYLKVFRKS